MTERTHAKTPFTLIYWQALDALELTIPDYLLLDTIHGFSLKTGWCYASRDELAARVRMKTRWVYKQLAVFAERGLVEIDPATRCIRPGTRWHKTLKALQAGQLPQVVTSSRKPRKKSASPTPAPDTEVPAMETDLPVDQTPAPHAWMPAPDAGAMLTDALHEVHTSTASHAGERMHQMQLTLHHVQTILIILYRLLNRN